MKTRTYNVFKFDELTDEQKEKAIENYYDINVDHDWWQFTKDDAENIGAKITAFDIDRGSYCELSLSSSGRNTCELILEEHGPGCETYKLARRYIDLFNAEGAIVDDENTTDEAYNAAWERLDNLTDQFTQELSEEYLSILRHEWEYLTSEEAIAETLRINEYDFTENGRID